MLNVRLLRGIKRALFLARSPVQLPIVYHYAHTITMSCMHECILEIRLSIYIASFYTQLQMVHCIPAGCVASGLTHCCTLDTCVTMGGCYCDQGCYDTSDCCEDIHQICPQIGTHILCLVRTVFQYSTVLNCYNITMA